MIIFACSKNKLARVRRDSPVFHLPSPRVEFTKLVKVQAFLKVIKLLSDFQPDKAEVHIPYTQKKSLWDQYVIESNKPGTIASASYFCFNAESDDTFL